MRPVVVFAVVVFDLLAPYY